MTEHGFSEDDVARYWNDNATSWAQEVRKGNDIAREWLNNPAVPRFDRTLSEYVNGVIAAGFVVTRMEEPRASEEYCLAHPNQRGWRDHAALFLYVRAEKPAL